ncbi:MAG TPA: class IV adenylate cyclase [Gemmatimonadaceae bacterium]
MLEIELKAVLPNLDAVRNTLERSGAELEFTGGLEDRRFDTPKRALRGRDEVLRLRVYRPDTEEARAYLDWKGPTSYDDGYKRREEISTSAGSAESLTAILENLGYVVTMAIDRRIWQYRVDGATVRLERYPRMDDLVEVEGDVDAIERAISRTGVARQAFSADRLPDFVRRYQARTRSIAALSRDELTSGSRQDSADA